MAMPRRQYNITSWDDVPVVMDLTMAARILGCSVESLRQWCVKGKMAGFRTPGGWRIRKDTLMNMVGVEA